MDLASLIEKNFRLTEIQKNALIRIGLKNIKDLLFYFPSRMSDLAELRQIRDLKSGDSATVYGKISGLKTKKAFRTGRPMGEAWLEDLSGKIKVVWFNQAYMAKMAREGQLVKLSGKVAEGKDGIYLSNPNLDKTKDLPIDSHDSLFQKDEDSESGSLHPVYPETRGITSLWFHHAIKKIIKGGALENISEYIPQEILKKYNLPTLKNALLYIHLPRKQSEMDVAKKRFSFEEIFLIQLARHIERAEYEKNKSYKVSVKDEDLENFISRFPFKATNAQVKAIDEVREDIKKDRPMVRLIEGDVGSGKTAVAAVASYAAIKSRPDGQDFGSLQVAYMAPTEILAAQHFENFIKYFTHTGINIGLITGSGCRKFPSKVASQKDNWTNISRTQLLKWVENGEIPIVIGTHALIQKSVGFKHLALAIIDEQHRFGANQRAKLAKKEGFAPHVLSMTATPIPRTLALTIYGDLDLTLLDELPAGRKTIITDIVAPDKRELAYEKIKSEMAEGRQLYVICPRIDEPDPDQELALNAKSVVAEAKRLKKEVFKDKEIGILHSKMSKEKKEEVMNDFSNGDIDILVATSVVEVGVNVPNATLIIIEGAERFGLAQLHQLRGRVIRSTHQAYCFLFSESAGTKTKERLNAIKTAKSGFELAELDLALRGAGELSGAKQWGVSDLGMEAIKNLKLVEAARNEAKKMVEEDSSLSKYGYLKNTMEKRVSLTHFE